MGEVRLEIHIEASPETVFAFLTEQEKLATWMAELVVAVGQPGGRLHAAGPVKAVEGTYLEIIPHEKVVFTWGGVDNLAPGQTTVEFRLRPEGSGTLLTLRHYNLPKPLVDAHKEGWAHGLPKLRDAAEGHPQPVTCFGEKVDKGGAT
jgi:uncharacterized protein YndB with AHSA1/START domain